MKRYIPLLQKEIEVPKPLVPDLAASQHEPQEFARLFKSKSDPDPKSKTASL